MPHDLSPNSEQAAIKHMYAQGMSILSVSHVLSLPYGRVRRELAAAGVPIRSRQEALRNGAAHPTSKLSSDERTRLVAELQAGEKQHRQLADEYGITRERVRQIARASDAPCGREIQRKLAEARKQAQVQRVQAGADKRKQARDERYHLWQDLWNRGLSLRDMAEQLGLSPLSIGVRITELRHSHPGWFPYRRVPSALRIMAQP